MFPLQLHDELLQLHQIFLISFQQNDVQVLEVSWIDKYSST